MRNPDNALVVIHVSFLTRTLAAIVFSAALTAGCVSSPPDPVEGVTEVVAVVSCGQLRALVVVYEDGSIKGPGELTADTQNGIGERIQAGDIEVTPVTIRSQCPDLTET